MLFIVNVPASHYRNNILDGLNRMRNLSRCFSIIFSLEPGALCNGHASPKTIAWLRDQQTGERGRSKPFIDSEVEVEGVDGESTAAEEEVMVAPRISQLSPLSSPGGGSIDHLVNTHLRRLFRFPFVEKVSLHPPGDHLRREFLSPVFFDWFNVSEGDCPPDADTSSRPPRP